MQLFCRVFQQKGGKNGVTSLHNSIQQEYNSVIKGCGTNDSNRDGEADER